MDNTASSSTSRHIWRWTYDVFLSFRGEDTRKNFVDHLYAALDQAGIYTFKDDQKLQRGESISPALLRAIEESMVAVVVFSKNYANSSWCLDELVKIVECQHLGQRVLPVFYDVDPSDVRGQKGSFHAAFQQHQVKFKDNMGKVNKWREALVTTANLSGWDVPQTANGHEARCIKQIVRRILTYNEFLPAENLIGMESRVRDVKSLLRKGDNDVLMIGIWGMGGIGKTTIARCVYNKISYEFEGSSFVEAVRENCYDKKGLKSLQEKLLSEILMEEYFNLKDCDDGRCQIQRRLGRKKVLVVLDDVDDFKQLEFLAGAREWFGPGSRVIVTTRDEHLLCYVQEKYTPELLKRTEAMVLFSRYAFKTNIPPKAYEELSDDVVSHSGHLPLALKALGSHFCGRSYGLWRSALRVLTKIPHKEINEILKLSFDGLNILEQKIFLHIACFFKGKQRANVTRVLDTFGLEPESGIQVLIEKSLLTISNGCLQMHDLIQDMGHFVVRERFPFNMVWVLEEIKAVMEASNHESFCWKVEAIVDTTQYHFADTPMACCSTEVFGTMKKLRLLDVKGNFTLSEPKYFPEELRWLCWYLYPFQSFKINSGMMKLVGLEMQCGQMIQLQIQKKVILPNLKFMDLSFSSSVISFPDISGVSNLESLNLSFCSELVNVHKSVLLHKRIVHLELSCCVSLKILASPINMKSLQTLHLNGCTSLERLPQVSPKMTRLLVLNIDGCDMIRTLPSSILLLTSLNILTMGKHSDMESEQELKRKHPRRILPNNLPIKQVSSLKVLDLRKNQLVEDNFPNNLHNVWPSLEKLDLSMNNFLRLFTGISQLYHLRYLNISHCKNLKELYGLPPLIQVLVADWCTSLQMCEGLFTDYKWLFKISLINYSNNFLPSFGAYIDLKIKNLIMKCAAVDHRLSITVPGKTIPNFFNIVGLDDKVALKSPQNNDKEIKGLAMCCRVRPTVMGEGEINLKIMFGSAVKGKLILPSEGREWRNHLWMGYIPVNFLMKLCQDIDSEDLVITFRTQSAGRQCNLCMYKDNFAPRSEFKLHNPDHYKSCSRKKIEACGARWVYNDDLAPPRGIELFNPRQMEFKLNDNYGVCSEDLQHGKWSKPSLMCAVEGRNIEYVHV